MTLKEITKGLRKAAIVLDFCQHFCNKKLPLSSTELWILERKQEIHTHTGHSLRSHSFMLEVRTVCEIY